MSLSPAMASKIELWTLEQLTPYAHNARTHSDEQIARIAASMLEFGVNNPILVDNEGGIVAGHGRLLAAQKLGLERVPVVVLNHLTPAQRRAYVIADNRLAELAGDFDLAMMGFSDAELQEILDAPDESDDESAPDMTEDGHNDSETVPESGRPTPLPRCVLFRGQALLVKIRLLGRHRLICGDSTQAETVQKLMGSAGKSSLAALSFTSPPYGNQRDYTAGIDDWDSLMRGVYAQMAHALRPDVQILVNLGLIHRENEVARRDSPCSSIGTTGFDGVGRSDLDARTRLAALRLVHLGSGRWPSRRLAWTAGTKF